MTENAKSSIGKMYVVGVGPGDPDLMTVKARKIIQTTPVVFVPVKDEKSSSYAQSIICDVIEDSSWQKVVPLVFPMVRDQEILVQHWHLAAETIWRYLQTGKDCAFINEGDPLLFGTGIYVFETLRRLHPEVDITVIPGISSINASAAAALLPLATSDERVTIITGGTSERVVRDALEVSDTVIIMKITSAFSKLLPIMEDLSLVDKCVVISKCSTPEQKVFSDIGSLKGQKLDYMSLMIIRK